MRICDSITRLSQAVWLLIPAFVMLFATVVHAGQQSDRPQTAPELRLEPVAQQSAIDRRPSRNIIQQYEPAGLGSAVTEYLSAPVAVPIDAPEPFLAVAGSWQADREAPGLVDFDLRFSKDGESWSDWLHAGHDHYEMIEDGLHFGELVFTDDQTRFVQYRARIDRDRDGRIPMISAIRLHFISPGASGAALLETVESKSPENRTISPENRTVSPENRTGPSYETDESRFKQSGGDQVMSNGSYPLPEYVDRETWSAHLNLTNTASRTPTNVTHLVVHHSAGNTNSSDFAAVVRSYWDFHTNSRNWGDIGYNWLVDPNGVIYQGRAFNLDGNKNVRGTHAGGFNTNSMGICVIGDYTNIRPSEIAVATMNEVLAWKADERGIDPLGSSLHSPTGINRRNILGHRDVTATSCPGNTFYPMLPEVRRQVALLVESWFDPGEVLVEQSWERSFDGENAFGWMGSGASETELSLDYHDGVVYVASNSDGPKIYMIDAEDGTVLDVLPLQDAPAKSVSGGADGIGQPLASDFFIATVRVTDDGYLVMSNRTVNAANQPFQILVLDPASGGMLDIFQFGQEPWRLGDQLSVTGSVSEGTVEIFAPVSVEGKVIRTSGIPRPVTGGDAGQIASDTDYYEILDLAGMQEWGRQAAIAPKTRGEHRGFFAGALRSDVIREYDEDVNPVGFVTFGEGQNNLSALQYASYQGREFLFAFHPEDRKLRVHTLFGQPGDAETNRSAYPVFLSEPLGSTSNRTTINIGDLTVRDNRDGSFDVFVLAPNNGIWSFYLEGPEYDEGVSAGDELAGLPDRYQLEQNYPNPFNPVTVIRYELPESKQVRLDVYSITGQRVATLVNERQSAGTHQVSFDASSFASGVYIYRLHAGSYVSSRQMTLIK
ncbi:MAG: T9SS C-terminal target domain-containing protein [Balneolaceae bacterium]|nr:MAG: T9SS C-terminal target domain-containing protein [Balneolaceae bacterium]